MIVQTTGADINVSSTKDYIQKKGIQIIHSSSKTQNATVFDISNNGFKNISDAFPNIPTVKAQWYQEDGFWKYRLADDQMAIGWHEINGKFYFFNGKGQMQTSRWIYTNDSWNPQKGGEYYYVHADGSRQPAGWFWHEGAWYYIQSDGTRRQNEIAYSGNNQYLFDKDGKMLTGWQTFNGKRKLFASSGELIVENDQASAWKKVNGKWYYFDNNNVEVTGLKEIDKVNYYFVDSGAMAVGWEWHDGAYYYYQASGAMLKEWYKEAGKWYYLNPETGKMVTGKQEVSGKYYYFNDSGAMQVGWVKDNVEWYYFKASGAMLRNGTTPDGYKVDGEGRWLPNGVTTTTTTTSTTEITTVEETTQDQTTQETTVEETTAEPTSQETTTKERRTIPIIQDDKPIRRVQDIF